MSTLKSLTNMNPVTPDMSMCDDRFQFMYPPKDADPLFSAIVNMLYSTAGDHRHIRVFCDESGKKDTDSRILFHGDADYWSPGGLISVVNPDKVTLSGLQAAIDASGACPGLKVDMNVVFDFQAIAPALVGPLVAGEDFDKAPNGPLGVGYILRSGVSGSVLRWRGGPLGAQAVWLRDRIMAEFAQASLRAQERKWTAALWIYMVSIVALAAAVAHRLYTLPPPAAVRPETAEVAQAVEDRRLVRVLACRDINYMNLKQN